MGKIVYIMAKSSTGKDTIFKELLRKNSFDFKTIVSYTTRPIRGGEKNGHEYFFTDEEGFLKLKNEGKIIEERCYNTVHGPWRYFTADDGQIDLKSGNYIFLSKVNACHNYDTTIIVISKSFWINDLPIPFFCSSIYIKLELSSIIFEAFPSDTLR